MNAPERQLDGAIDKFNNSRFSDFIMEAETHPRSGWKMLNIPTLKSGNVLHTSDLEKSDLLASSLEDTYFVIYPFYQK